MFHSVTLIWHLSHSNCWMCPESKLMCNKMETKKWIPPPNSAHEQWHSMNCKTCPGKKCFPSNNKCFLILFSNVQNSNAAALTEEAHTFRFWDLLKMRKNNLPFKRSLSSCTMTRLPWSSSKPACASSPRKTELGSPQLISPTVT